MNITLFISIYYTKLNYSDLSLLYTVDKSCKDIIHNCKIIPINLLIKNYLSINITDIYFLLKYDYNFKLLYYMLKYRPYYKHQFIINLITFFLKKKNIFFDKIDQHIYYEILDITDNIIKQFNAFIIQEKFRIKNYEKHYKERFGINGKINNFIKMQRNDYIQQEIISDEIEKNQLLHIQKYSNIYKKLL